MDRLLSRKFLLTALAALYIVGATAGGLISVQEGMDQLKWIIGIYVTAEGAGDFAGRLKPDIKEVPPATP